MKGDHYFFSNPLPCNKISEPDDHGFHALLRGSASRNDERCEYLKSIVFLGGVNQLGDVTPTVTWRC